MRGVQHLLLHLRQKINGSTGVEERERRQSPHNEAALEGKAHKMRRITGHVSAWAIAFALLVVPAALADTFCWKNSNGRGVGTIPTNCGAKENDAGLCYTKCPANYKGVGPVCWQVCPSGYSDFGVGCSKPASYGRGAGYPWKFGDGLNDNGMFKRCRAANSQGCEKNGAIVYPKCKPGFHQVGCCVCSPDCPAGLIDSGVSCTKKSQGRGAAPSPWRATAASNTTPAFATPSARRATTASAPCAGRTARRASRLRAARAARPARKRARTRCAGR